MTTKLLVSDLSNIEGRVLSYLAGEKWKLRAFRDFDAGTGPDPYNLTATSIIGGDPYNVPKNDRNIYGKVPDLACGYQGGPGALATFEKAYGVRIFDHWDTIQANVNPAHIEQAFENYSLWGEAKALEGGISKEEWASRETIKLAWRARHPATVKFWRKLEDAVRDAMRHPGKTFTAGKHLKVGVRRNAGINWLLVKLPSGNYLTYFKPHFASDGRTIMYYGMGSEEEGSYSKTWTRLHTYGGKLAENATQSLSRDILMHGARLAEADGLPVILSVHDELLNEVPDEPEYTVQRLSDRLVVVPDYVPGLPLAAAGFETYRYRKD